MLQPFHWNSLKTRITALTLAISLLGLAVVLFVSGALLRSDLKQLLTQQQTATVALVASDINEALAFRISSLEELAKLIERGQPGQRAEWVQAHLEDHPIVKSLFNDGLFATDAQGQIIADTPLSAQRMGRDVSDREYFKAALQGKPHISAPIIGRKSLRPIVVMAVPLHDAQGRVNGVLVGNINLGQPNFLDRLTENRYGRTGETFIVTPQNRMIVSSSDKKRVMEVLPAPGVSPWIDRFMQGYEGSAVVTNPHGLEVLVTVKQVPIAGWYTSVILSTQEAFAPVNEARSRFFTYLAPLVVLLIVGLTWWALRRELTPLMDTTRKLTQLALSDQPLQPLPISRHDEVGALIGGFNHLLQTLAQRQSALQESKARFKVLADNAPALVWMSDLDGQASYFNQVWLDFTGRSLDQEVRSGWVQGVHPDDLQRASRAFISAFKLRQPCSIDYRLRRFDGQYRWLTFHGVPCNDAQGQFAGYIGSGIDITERKQSEERLQLLASVFTHANEGILISRADGTILDINEGFSRITGYSLADVLGKTPRILASGLQDKAFYALMWQTLISLGQWRGEVWNRRKNGELYAALLTISAVHDAQGQVSHYVALSSDISALKAHEAQLEKMAHFDNLTGLPNRLMLMDRLQQAMPQAQRRAQRLALVFIDLDGFKEVNDQYGHEAGDLVLQTVASRMKHALRVGDTLARLGGDEFVAVLLDVSDLHLFEALLQRLLAAAAQPVAVGELTLHVSASLGVTFYPQAEDLGADQLLRQADQAMYRAKLAGKNRFAVFSALAR